MIIWINGAFGAGKTTAAAELCRRLPGSFCYDPENAGYFLRKNTPACCHTPDFQDTPLWRQINRETLSLICRRHPGPVVAPMTLVNWQYWREILEPLEREGVRIEHFILQADRRTIVRRLRKRSLGMLSREQFALDAIDRCLAAFEQAPEAHRIQTEDKTPEQIAEQIAAQCGLTLASDGRNSAQRGLSRLKTWASHIRMR